MAAVRQTYPNAELHCLVRREYASLLGLAPWIDRVWSYRRNRRSLSLGSVVSTTRALRAERFDVAIDLMGSDHASTAAWLSGAKRRLVRRPGPVRTTVRLALVRHRPDRIPVRPGADVPAALAQPAAGRHPLRRARLRALARPVARSRCWVPRRRRRSTSTSARSPSAAARSCRRRSSSSCCFACARSGASCGWRSRAPVRGASSARSTRCCAPCRSRPGGCSPARSTSRSCTP